MALVARANRIEQYTAVGDPVEAIEIESERTAVQVTGGDPGYHRCGELSHQALRNDNTIAKRPRDTPGGFMPPGLS